MRKTIFILAAALITFCGGCYYDRYNELHPLDGYIDTCSDTLTDNYTSVVRNIMLLNCTSCHNKSVHQGGVILTSYNDVKQYVDNGKLMGSVQHQNNYKSMPPNTWLRDCDIQQLKTWIDNGMPQ